MNPENQNLYSISDLADQVGVPRTTITDWLGKYSRFIELQTQGRRRFYTDRTLSVLCKVAELRTAGRSIGDIDGELERIFPVHPTVEPPDAAAGKPRVKGLVRERPVGERRARRIADDGDLERARLVQQRPHGGGPPFRAWSSADTASRGALCTVRQRTWTYAAACSRRTACTRPSRSSETNGSPPW